MTRASSHAKVIVKAMDENKTKDIILRLDSKKLTPRFLCVLKSLYSHPKNPQTLASLKLKAGYEEWHDNNPISVVIGNSELFKERFNSSDLENTEKYQPFLNLSLIHI